MENQEKDRIAANLERVRERIARAAQRAGRRPEEVRLVAVTKNVDVPRIQAALAAGVTEIGENRVQEARLKRPALGSAVRWHLIGTLQTNKVKAALQLFDLIHSLDRWSLAEELARRATAAGRVVEVLVEVNVSGEATKAGLAPGEVLPFLERVHGLAGLRVRGLMTVAPATERAEEVRPFFRTLARLRAAAVREGWTEVTELSMGMSGDFEVAVEEGATLVRLGTAIFGPRNQG
ncbi:MAG: YggS family pyridoxal phosphate-dependent enzyme [Bacillota bacterium]|nr:YggS family pyridoxal phosphate-dependent enzyme [Bacillota bacterium]